MIETQQKSGNKNSYVCTMANCGKTFSSRFCLKRHLITLHMGFKRFVCNVCGRNFAQKQYLTEHINTHTQNHPYACDFPGCTKKFKQRSRQCLHKKLQHGQHMNGNISDIDTEKDQFQFKKKQHLQRNGYKINKPQQEIIYNVPQKDVDGDMSDTISVENTEAILPKLNEVEIKAVEPVQREQN